MLVFEERGKPEYLDKNLSNQHESQPTNRSVLKPRPHRWEASAITTEPTLLPTTEILQFNGILEVYLTVDELL